MAKSKRALIVSGEEDRAHLERIGTDPHSIPEHVPGATIVLRLGYGPAPSRTTGAAGMSKPSVRRRRRSPTWARRSSSTGTKRRRSSGRACGDDSGRCGARGDAEAADPRRKGLADACRARARVAGRREMVGEFVGYCRSGPRRMSCGKYRRRGLPVGSGGIKSGCGRGGDSMLQAEQRDREYLTLAGGALIKKTGPRPLALLPARGFA